MMSKSLSTRTGELSFIAVKEKFQRALPFALMLVFALSRIPGMLPQNFGAAYALAFCGGVFFSGAMAWWLPLGTLIVTDVLLNAFYYHVPPFNGYMLLTLVGFTGIVAIGRCFKPQM